MLQLTTAEQALAAGDVAAARAAVNQAVVLAAFDPAVQVMVARVTVAEGDAVGGEAMLRAVLSRHPNHLGASGTLGSLLVGLKRHADAGPFLDKAVLGGFAPASVKMAYGRYLASAGKVQRAVLFFQQAAQEAPRVASAHFFLGVALAETGKLAEAQKSLIEAVKLEPTDIDAWSMLISLQATADIEVALSSLAEAQRINPGTVQLWRVGAQVASAANRPAEALHALGQIPLEAREADDWSNVAWLAITQQDSDSAIKAASKAVAADSKNARAHYMLGLALEGAATLDRPKIEQQYRKAIEFGDPSGEAATRLGLLLIEEATGGAPRSAEAVTILEAARTRSADAPATLWHLALALRQTGRTADAKTLAEQIAKTEGVPASIADQARRLAAASS